MYLTYKINYGDNYHLRFLNVLRSLGLCLTTPIPAVVILAETAFPAFLVFADLSEGSGTAGDLD